MASLRSCLLGIVSVLMLLGSGDSQTQKFYPDDPIASDPPPVPVGDIKKIEIYPLYDYFYQTGRSQRRDSQTAAGINTVGEVTNSAWFTNRHGRIRMTRSELQQGAGIDHAPQPPFIIVGAKTEGITPGFRMRDAAGRLYFVKPDPVANPEMMTASDVLGSKFFYAIGYNTPENYIVRIRKSDWSIDKNARIKLKDQLSRKMSARDFHDILEKVAMLPDGSFRVLASLAIPGKGLGPFRYEGTRSDDPNDLVPHQDRRELRGLFVFCAWLNHTDAKSENSYDALTQVNGSSFVRHYLLDFGSAFGSDGDIPKDARFGHEYQIPSAGKALGQLFSLGLYPSKWEQARYPRNKAVGRLEAQIFDPDKWKPNYPNPAFLSRRADDEYWAAKIVLAFTDDDIRALVETGEYSDPQTVDIITRTLAQRRDKIGRCYLSKVLPLENFRIRGGALVFEDLAVRYGFRQGQDYRIAWSTFDNEHGTFQPLPDASDFRLPNQFNSIASGNYLAARIHASTDDGKAITLFLRKTGATAEVVGLEREWR
jgi:hypothetical protein